MKLCRDPKIGYYGEIVNCINLIDLGKKTKMSMKIPDQVSIMQENILLYNGEGVPDYINIDGFLMDFGAGGQPSGYADILMNDWVDSKGDTHKGFIDETHDLYKEEAEKYPNACTKFYLINPKRYRNQMCEELIELMNHDLIRFPKEYDGKNYIIEEKTNSKGEVELVERILTTEERVALINIDAMKTELTSIHKFKDNTGMVIRYSVPDQHMKDDRFYSLLLLAHHLYSIRRNDFLNKDEEKLNVMDYLFIS